jgi:multisubunit Na+/H+ antiporter MnhB subunit
VRRSTKLLLSGVGFGVLVSTLIALASGSPQLGLQGGFWIALTFVLWLEWRLP